MKKLYSLLIALLCVSGLQARTAEPTKVLSAYINKAKEQGVVFQAVDLFTNITGAKHNVLKEETLLAPNANNIKEVYNNYPQAITLTFKATNGTIYTLDMMRSTPLAFQPDMGYIDLTGEHKCSFERGAHYQGAVKGFEQSFAAASIFANGEVMILFGNSDGNFVVGKLEDNSGNYVFYNDRDMAFVPAACGVDDYAKYQVKQNNGTANKTTATYVGNKISMYFESDYGTYVNKGKSVTAVQNYLTGLFNQVQTLYKNEKVAMELKSVYVWTVADGYDSSSSGSGLNSFKNRWDAKGDTFNANVGMLIAKDPGGNGGVAFLNVSCVKSYGFAYADVDVAYQTVPTYSWDVNMVTHEFGHSLGSHHTHWCGWMTNSGGCGSIDDCTNKETDVSVGCGSVCAYETYQNSQPVTAWKGTIMSYCHLVARGVDLANGFGPLPGNTIRNTMSVSPCLPSLVSYTLAVTPICKADGAVTLTFDANLIGSSNFGTAPYTYLWSTGATTQSITNITAPGSYSVEVTDANGVKAKVVVNVPTDPTSGCWPAGINNPTVDGKYVSVYPNPASKEIAVKYYAANNSTTTLKITDLMGKVVVSNTMNTVAGENNATVNINGLAKGVYFLKLQAGDKQYDAVKLVVE
ncbi:MAG: zinc-dependent metalloprotease [Bacteroidetes bacterium]|nr:zinc-dependent metalloprotease [Bacteroidota bacterium]